MHEVTCIYQRRCGQNPFVGASRSSAPTTHFTLDRQFVWEALRNQILVMVADEARLEAMKVVNDHIEFLVLCLTT